MSIQEPTIQQPTKPSDSNLTKQIPLGIFGAVLGAVVGFFLFQFLIQRGLYFIVLPGAIVGWGCAFAARSRSFAFAIIAASVAIPATIFYEWHTDAYLADDGQTLISISQYVARMIELRGWKLPALIGLNGVIAFWLGRRG